MLQPLGVSADAEAVYVAEPIGAATTTHLMDLTHHRPDSSKASKNSGS